MIENKIKVVNVEFEWNVPVTHCKASVN